MVKFMDTSEQLPVLLKIKNENGNIKLRLDDNGLGCFTENKRAIHEITLSGCRINEELNNHLQELVTEVFEYEVFEQDNKKVFQFWGDY